MLLTTLYLYTQPINKSTLIFPIRLHYSTIQSFNQKVFQLVSFLIIYSQLTYQGTSSTYIVLSYIAISFSSLFLVYYRASLVVILYYNYNYYLLISALQILAQHISVKALITIAFSYYICLTLYALLYTLQSTLQLIYLLVRSSIYLLVLYYLAQYLYLASLLQLLAIQLKPQYLKYYVTRNVILYLIIRQQSPPKKRP